MSKMYTSYTVKYDRRVTSLNYTLDTVAAHQHACLQMVKENKSANSVMEVRDYEESDYVNVKTQVWIYKCTLHCFNVDISV